MMSYKWPTTSRPSRGNKVKTVDSSQKGLLAVNNNPKKEIENGTLLGISDTFCPLFSAHVSISSICKRPYDYPPAPPAETPATSCLGFFAAPARPATMPHACTMGHRHQQRLSLSPPPAVSHDRTAYSSISRCSFSHANADHLPCFSAWESENAPFGACQGLEPHFITM